MRRIYSVLPNVRVEPYRLTPQNLTVSRILSLMQVDITAVRRRGKIKLTAQPVPLYLGQALGVLQDLGADGFSLDEFYRRLAPVQEA